MRDDHVGPLVDPDRAQPLGLVGGKPAPVDRDDLGGAQGLEKIQRGVGSHGGSHAFAVPEGRANCNWFSLLPCSSAWNGKIESKARAADRLRLAAAAQTSGYRAGYRNRPRKRATSNPSRFRRTRALVFSNCITFSIRRSRNARVASLPSLSSSRKTASVAV